MTWLPGIWFLVAIYILVLSLSWRARRKKLEDWAQAKGLKYTHLVLGDERERLTNLLDGHLNRAGKRIEKIHHMMESQDGSLVFFQYGGSLGGRMQYATLAMPGMQRVDPSKNLDPNSLEINPEVLVVMTMMNLTVLEELWEQMSTKTVIPKPNELESKG